MIVLNYSLRKALYITAILLIMLAFIPSTSIHSDDIVQDYNNSVPQPIFIGKTINDIVGVEFYIFDMYDNFSEPKEAAPYTEHPLFILYTGLIEVLFNISLSSYKVDRGVSIYTNSLGIEIGVYRNNSFQLVVSATGYVNASVLQNGVVEEGEYSNIDRDFAENIKESFIILFEFINIGNESLREQLYRDIDVVPGGVHCSREYYIITYKRVNNSFIPEKPALKCQNPSYKYYVLIKGLRICIPVLIKYYKVGDTVKPYHLEGFFPSIRGMRKTVITRDMVEELVNELNGMGYSIDGDQLVIEDAYYLMNHTTLSPVIVIRINNTSTILWIGVSNNSLTIIDKAVLADGSYTPVDAEMSEEYFKPHQLDLLNNIFNFLATYSIYLIIIAIPIILAIVYILVYKR